MAKKSFKIGELEFDEVKSVTRPVLKIESKAVFFRVDGLIHPAPATEAGREQKDANGKVLPPPNLMDVTNLETDEQNIVVVNTVMGKNLEETYPDSAYVGKSFKVVKFAPANGKRYATFQIAEIALKVAAPAATQAAKPAVVKK